MKIRKKPARYTAAFTLIEVTIALAITAVALVTLMGMIPRGLETMREAADQAIEARIHQQVLGEMQLTPFDSATGAGGNSPLDDFDKQLRYYDNQGIELLDSQKGSLEHLYTARIHVPKSGTLPKSVGGESYNGVAIPGSDSEKSEYLRLVIVEITAIPNSGDFDWDAPKNQRFISTFQSTLVKMGQDFEQQ